MIYLSALIFIATFCSILTGYAGYALANHLDRDDRTPSQSVWIWRMARLAALLPFAILLLLPVLPDPPRSIQDMPVVSAMREPVQQAQSFISSERPESLFETAIAAPSSTEETTPVSGQAAGQANTQAETGPSRTVIGTVWLAGIIIVIYLVGLAFSGAGFVFNRLAIGHLVSAGFQPSAALRDRLEQWASALGLKSRDIRLTVSDRTTSPFLTGVRPRVIVPSAFDAGEIDPVREYALVHELVHARRGDEIDRLTGEILGILLWFNPSYGRIESRLSLAREMACDAETLKALGQGADRRAYARALIDEPWVELPTSTMISAFGFSVGKVRKMRIKAILSNRGTTGGQAMVTGAAALMFAALAVPVATAQVVMSSTLTSAAVSEVVEAFTGTEQGSARDADVDEATPIRRSIASSPLAGLMALESLETLESLDNLDEEAIFRNPLNWAAVGAYLSGASETLTLNVTDDNGNPMRIRANPENESAAEIEFTDQEGRRVLLDAEIDPDGHERVTIGYVGEEEPYFSVIANDDGADLRFYDPEGRPTLMGVRELDEVAVMRIEDVMSGAQAELVFNDYQDGEEIYVPADGYVVEAGTDDPSGNSVGQYVVIDHENGWSTIFFNLEERYLQTGQRVSQGEPLGIGGESDFDWDGGSDVNGMDIMDNINLSIVRTETLEL